MRYNEFDITNSFAKARGGKLMKYAGMPMGMWMLFHRSFTRQLMAVLGQSAESAKATEKTAKQEYRRIIARVPDFEPGDRFQMNFVNCAMLCAYVLHMPKRPTVQTLTDYYAKSMMTPAMLSLIHI